MFLHNEVELFQNAAAGKTLSPTSICEYYLKDLFVFNCGGLWWSFLYLLAFHHSDVSYVKSMLHYHII